MDGVCIAAHMAGHHFAARHRDEVRGERHLDRIVTGHQPQFLLDLRRMPVGAHPIGMDAFGHLAEQVSFLQATASPGCPGLGVDDDRVRIDDERVHQRQKDEQDRGRVAARTRHEVGPGDLVGIKLTEPIDGIGSPLWRKVLAAIGSRIGLRITETVVSRQVDHFHMRWKRFNQVLAGAMRQTAERHVHLVPANIIRRHNIEVIGP